MLNLLKKEILPHAKEYCESNWNEIYDAVRKGLWLYERAMREGILSLEDGADDLKPDFLKFFLRLCIDGASNENIEEIMLNWFYANNLSGLDAYLFLIYGTVVLALTSYDKQMFVENIKSIIPEAFYEQLTMLTDFVKTDNEERERIFALIAADSAEEIFDFKLFSQALYDEKNLRERDRHVQERLKKLKVEVIADALHYSTKKFVNKLFRNMDNRLVMDVVRRLRIIGGNGCSIRDAHEARDVLAKQKSW